MKRIMQFRYRGDNHEENFPNFQFYTDILSYGNIFQEYGLVTKLGIQAPVGIRFYLNSSSSPIMVGETGIYELNLEGIGRINSIRFDRSDLEKYYTNNPRNDKILIDIVYEGV